MEIHRIGGVPINFDTCTPGELHGLRRYAAAHLQEALNEVSTLNQYAARVGLYGLKAVPEFGEPLTSFEHDPFADFPPPNLDYTYSPPPEAA